MTAPPTPTASPVDNGSAATVRCPHCLDSFRWDEQTVYERTELGAYNQFAADLITDPVKREERLRDAYVRCPNPSGDAKAEHYLPLGYLRYLPPLVIGLVGTAAVGKSTLLAAMVNEIDRGGLIRYGFNVRPLVHERHMEFRRTRLERLMQTSKALNSTAPAAEGVEFADAFLLVKETAVQPVIFFDVGGESLADVGPTTRFIQAVGALIFVVDPDRALGRVEGSRDAAGQPTSEGDLAFNAVIGRLSPPSGLAAQHLDRPAAIVLAKADTLRFEPPVSRWLSQPEGTATAIDAGLIRAESRDVYAFLYQHDASPWLKPFDSFRRCTLHVVSATGSSAVDQSYRHGLRPRRVLDPLIAILAMTGVIGGPGADQVGR